MNYSELLWTFGNHEPVSMYRRIGGKCTGGGEGGALWLEDWHNWFDSEECVKLISELGFNALHCRFYKGMGWEFEKHDYPAVKKFVERCHKYGIKVLAYVQISTLYYEVMLEEIPELKDWAAIDENGRIPRYHAGQYCRWMPCINNPSFPEYLEKVISIALEDGKFDGIMFDNCFIAPCYCDRCRTLFRGHLKRLPNGKELTGLPFFNHVEIPLKSENGEIKDPVYREWVNFRTKSTTDFFKRLYKHIKEISPKAVVCGNTCNIRRTGMHNRYSIDVTSLKDAMDIFLSQSLNAPELIDGCVITGSKEMKLSSALGKAILPLNDSDAINDSASNKAMLAEPLFSGGIPFDRNVVAPDRKNFVSSEKIKTAKPLLDSFRKYSAEYRKLLEAPEYSPVCLYYSNNSVKFSARSWHSLTCVEHMLFCGNVPYTLTCPLPDKPLALPEECALLIVPESLCLSNTECADIKALAAKGKTRVLILGDETGLYDENYRQRKENIFESEAEKNGISKNAGNFIFPLINGDFQMKIKIPDEINKTFFKLLGKVYAPELRIDAEFGICSFVRKNKKQFSVNLINYAPEGTPLKVSVKQKLSETKEYKIIYPFGGLENGIFQRRPDKSLNTNFKISDAASLIFDAR